ncbi:hypothetical protein [Pseudomonas syringae]|nr:hypothetical protein [Pseudomonas syringae]
MKVKPAIFTKFFHFDVLLARLLLYYCHVSSREQSWQSFSTKPGKAFAVLPEINVEASFPTVTFRRFKGLFRRLTRKKTKNNGFATLATPAGVMYIAPA